MSDERVAIAEPMVSRVERRVAVAVNCAIRTGRSSFMIRGRGPVMPMQWNTAPPFCTMGTPRAANPSSISPTQVA